MGINFGKEISRQLPITNYLSPGTYSSKKV
jgi:hypothetical protein